MSIYPNPAKSELSIELTTELETDAQLVVYNSVCRAIIIDQISDSYYQLSVSDLSSEMYILRLIHNNKVVTKRFAKE